jgi:hypothetical protein
MANLREIQQNERSSVLQFVVNPTATVSHLATVCSLHRLQKASATAGKIVRPRNATGAFQWPVFFTGKISASVRFGERRSDRAGSESDFDDV